MKRNERATSKTGAFHRQKESSTASLSNLKVKTEAKIKQEIKAHLSLM